MIGVYDYTVIATYASLFVGLCGIFAAMDGEPLFAVLALMIAGILDAFDGRIARTKKNRTEREKRFGIQIDSLNDLVCFGVLPAVIGFASFESRSAFFLASLAFFTLAALIRLAFFNVTEEERQNTTNEVRKYYLGLPVTSAALLIPFFWILAHYLPVSDSFGYGAACFLLGVLFITPVQIKKPGLLGILVFAALGLAELAFLFVGLMFV
ncbi:MAG: CDP-alcohol phosphatidyltransferase family protein [Oscillospiraceae bacterium]|nr:CDP-alcohol phosphatidyltransferase family protein [Oscillospiraceae bacterium]